MPSHRDTGPSSRGGGLFISFEGGERSGKSTQSRLLAEWLERAGYSVLLVREPGSTPLGQRLRRLVKGQSMTPMAELLLFGAARAELVSTVIGPHLQAGGIVVSDRFADSTVAYQQYGRMLPAEHVEAAIRLATGGLTPDITFLLDLPPNRQQRRAGQAQMGLDLGEAQRRAEADDGTQARFERESQEFHRRVRVGYRALAQKEPGRWSVLDAAASIQDVHALVLALTKPLLPAPPAVHSPLRDLTDLSDAG